MDVKNVKREPLKIAKRVETIGGKTEGVTLELSLPEVAFLLAAVGQMSITGAKEFLKSHGASKRMVDDISKCNNTGMYATLLGLVEKAENSFILYSRLDYLMARKYPDSFDNVVVRERIIKDRCAYSLTGEGSTHCKGSYTGSSCRDCWEENLKEEELQKLMESDV